MRILKLTISLALLAIACRPGRTTRPEAISGEPYLIMGSELDPARQATIYDAVRQLRPSWLTRPVGGRTGDNTILVYLDGQVIGNLSVLRRLTVTTAERILYMSPTEAQTRFGSRNVRRAAIVIETERP
jgi:hypothetical protein